MIQDLGGNGWFFLVDGVSTENQDAKCQRETKKENSLYLWTYHFCPPLNPTQDMIGSLNESLKQ
jgi:hypothetical protein